MTIEERARDYACHVSLDELNKDGLDAESFCGIIHGYINGATEQQKIDVEKACSLVEELVDNTLNVLEKNLEGMVFDDHKKLMEIASQEMRKAMEE